MYYQQCHGEPVEPCCNIEYLHSPFDELRVTDVTFYMFIKIHNNKKANTTDKASVCVVNQQQRQKQ